MKLTKTIKKIDKRIFNLDDIVQKNVNIQKSILSKSLSEVSFAQQAIDEQLLKRSTRNLTLAEAKLRKLLIVRDALKSIEKY